MISINFEPRIQCASKSNSNKETISNDKNNNNKENNQLEIMDESAKSHDFLQSHKPSNKRINRKYTTTRIKSRIFFRILHMLK